MEENVRFAWLKAFRRAVKAGNHCIFLTGSIGDGFPSLVLEDGKPAADQLVPLTTILAQQASPKTLVVTYELGAFRFPSDDQETEFRRWLGLPTRQDLPPNPQSQARPSPAGAPGNPHDPFARARHDLVQQEAREALAVGPDQAIQLILACLQAATAAERPCLVMLPDVDAICSSQPTGNSERIEFIAMVIAKVATTDAFRRAGHVLVMTAPGTQALCSRLQRLDLGIKVLPVRRPNAEEREAFVRSSCDQPHEELVQARDQILARVQEIERHTVRRLGHEAHETELRLADIEARRETILVSDEPTNAAKRRLGEAQIAYEEALREDSRRRTQERALLEARIAELESRLRTDPSLAIRDLDNAEWRRFAVGDHLVIVQRKHDGSARAQKRVMQVLADGSIHLSHTGKFEDVQQTQIGNAFVPDSHQWRDNRIVRVQGGTQTIPLSNDAASQKRMPKLRVEAEEAFFQAREQMDRPNVVGPAVAEAQQKRDEAVSAVEDAKKAALTRWSADREAITDALERIESKLRRPREQVAAGLVSQLAKAEKALEAVRNQTRYPLPSMGLREFARLTQGLGYRDLFSLLYGARAENRVLTVEEVTARRLELLMQTYGHLIKVSEPAYGFEGIAGLDGIKDFLRDVCGAMRAGDLAHVPMGCLLMGPPGTGKTAIAQAFARESGMLFVELRSTRSQWVGVSERQTEEILAALRDLAPVTVLRDEVDQEDSGRDAFQGDSGVSARIRQAWMQFLSDPAIRGRVFVISCSNRPDLMDPALKRSGRTDERIPVLMPDHATRVSLFNVMVQRYGFASTVASYEDAARLTDRLSGADIEVIVRHAHDFARHVRKPWIDDEVLREAIADFLPSASQTEIAKMTLAAVRETSSRRFLPGNIAEIVAAAERMISESRDRVGQQRMETVVIPVAISVSADEEDEGSGTGQGNAPQGGGAAN